MTDTDRLDQARTVPLDDVTPSPDQAQTVPLGESVPPGATKPMPQYPRQHQQDTQDDRQSPPASWSATPRVGSGPVGGPGSGRGSGMTAGQFYRDAWRRLPRDFGYMALTAVLLCTLYFAFPAAVFGGGFRDLFNPFVLLMFFIALFVARWLGQFEKLRMSWADRRPIRPVDWTPRWQQNWWTRTGSAVANPHYWLYLLHAAVVYPLVAVATVGTGALLLVGFAWPIVVGGLYFANNVRVGYFTDSVGFVTGVGALGLLSMTASVVLFPLWARGSVLAHYWVDFGLLGGFRAEQLEQRVAGLQASRAGAVTAEGQALRQIERDLHDGPQQRLVRLRMDLSAAERAFEKDPEKAKQLIGEASEHAQDALDELRALSRGFAPPILLDRGLVAALEALVARTPIPVGLDVRLPEGLELATEIQRNVYFTVSELLTNTMKHAGATTAGVYLGLVVDASGLWYLTVSVTDDGRGGARPQQGHGIEGLIGRMRALDGDLVVSSPEGGPTEATARIPLGALNGVPTAANQRS
ncbi:sensor histidine kinase [Curtobacterium flaccumfaciens pv. flaccumfaciens]|uniref:histidine kinase n=1 Tax=Curtobacterium poinsettiae TaxID=159612 RepID=A0ABT3S2I2_9MICO|nr:sensor histidine kinase [Curtobacterium flaccumfaciens]MBT1610578.1 sensor histidine kinase [Curtobacterium flaccumfaciens pv. poinsettiae]MCS6575911.1 sensor histidine kinase [Curtobacterium flaccumfaciens pv. flaccumfaciens]MCX2849032.1 sensor histidine kinase [Curtobacterium flaccumfaciens pv. poinsettiae]UXN19944.1 sensor histidine kinase [Curtobacterium flaccumfaciens pv. poinsettiae]